MPKAAPTDKMEKLRLKQSQIAAQLRDLEAKASAQARKDDTRRKVIAGALALEHMQKNAGSEFGKVMLRLLDEYALPRDRHLFPDLPTKSDTAPPSGKKNGAADKPPHAEVAAA